MAAGVVLTASGCGGESSAAPATGLDPAAVSRVAHATKHTTPSTTPPATRGTYTLPDAAKAHTQAGAIAFVRFYWETLANLDAHPQTGVIPTFSSPGCTSCQMQESTMADMASQALSYRSITPQTSRPTVRADSNDDSVVVQFVYQDSGTKEFSRGQLIKTSPPRKVSFEFRADWTSQGWDIGAGAQP